MAVVAWLLIHCTPVAPPSAPSTPPAAREPQGELVPPAEPVPADEPMCTAGAVPEPTSVDRAARPTHARLVTLRDDVLLALPLTRAAFTTHVAGPVAETTVTQVFDNPLDQPIEAYYELPLPDGAHVESFDLRAGSLTVRSTIQELESARQIYWTARPPGTPSPPRKPGFPGVFMQGVAAVPPRTAIEVSLRLVHPVRLLDGHEQLTLPTALGAPCPAVAARVRLQTGHIPDAVRATHHAIRVARPREHTDIQLVDALPNRDLVLTWRSDARPRADLLAQQGADGGHFALVIHPPAAAAVAAPRPREIVFVLDTARAMHGPPLDLARAIIADTVEHARPGDVFQILDLDDANLAFAPGLTAVDPDARARLKTWLAVPAPASGPAPNSGLQRALELPRDPTRVRQVLILTNRNQGNSDRDLLEFFAPKLADTRVHAFVFNNYPSTTFLADLPRVGRGTVFRFGPAGHDPEAALRHADAISRPVLTDISVHWGGLAVADVLPAQLPDVHAGQPLVLLGRYTGPPSAVRVLATLGDAPVELPVGLAVDSDAHTGLASAWASRVIDDLQSWPTDARKFKRDGNAIQRAVVDLALRHRVATRFTTLVTSAEQVVTAPDGARTTVSVARPVGTDSDGDTVPDIADACPDFPESLDGRDDDDGCPELQRWGRSAGFGVIKGIFFDARTAAIKPKSRPVLDRAVEILKEFDTVRIEISGHTDVTEPAEFSHRRAEATRDYLMKAGIDAKRIEVRGAGSDEPIDTNKTKPGRAKNRRIEFTILVY